MAIISEIDILIIETKEDSMTISMIVVQIPENSLNILVSSIVLPITHKEENMKLPLPNS